MHPSVSRKILGISIVLLAVLLIVIPLGLSGRNQEEDTTAIQGEINSKGEHVKIRIDKRGVSIEREGAKKGEEKKDDRTTFVFTTPPKEQKISGSDLVRFGQDIHIYEDEIIRGDVVAFGGDVTLEGRVMGDVVVIGGHLKAQEGAEINGDAVVIGGKLETEPDVNIQGQKVVIDTPIPLFRLSSIYGPHARVIGLVSWPIKFIFFLLFAFLVILFMQKRIEQSRSYLKLEYFRSFGWGLLIGFIGVFVIPIVMLLLAITLIGIPLAVLVFFSCIAVLIIAWTIFTYDLGVRVKEKWHFEMTSAYALVLVGTFILFLPKLIGYSLSVIPFMWPLGFAIRVLASLIFLFAVACGLGALFTSRFGKREAGLSGAPISPEATPGEPTVPPEATE
jgi:hypothetical protein